MQTKTISDIEIITQHDFITLINLINGSVFRFSPKENFITFRDSFGNTMQNQFGTITVNNVIYKLTTEGDNIKFEDGTTIALLSNKDIRELAQNTFYEKGQPHIYDFMELKFK